MRTSVDLSAIQQELRWSCIQHRGIELAFEKLQSGDLLLPDIAALLLLVGTQAMSGNCKASARDLQKLLRLRSQKAAAASFQRLRKAGFLARDERGHYLLDPDLATRGGAVRRMIAASRFHQAQEAGSSAST